MNNLLQVAMEAVKAVPEVAQYLSETSKAELLGYPPIRANYWAEIYDSVEQYLTGNKPVTSFRNKASIAVSEAFTDAVYEGYAQAGAELPLPDDIQAWLSQRIAEERTHIEGMFDRLKAEWEGLDWIKEAYARADGYAKTLDMVFQEAKMRGADNATLVFVGDDGAESCPDCQRMQGKRHTIKYILAHNLIPKPGNSTYECNGYNCQHYWMNPKTGEIYGGETKAMKGGEGSGNFGHAGRPGEVGGSAAGGGGLVNRLDRTVDKLSSNYIGTRPEIQLEHVETNPEHLQHAMGHGTTGNIWISDTLTDAEIQAARDYDNKSKERAAAKKEELENYLYNNGEINGQTLVDAGLGEEELERLYIRLSNYNEIISRPFSNNALSVDDVIAHEFGHHIVGELGSLGISTNLTGRMLDEIAAEYGALISEYATTSGGEYFAEAYVSFVRGEYDKIHPEVLSIFRQSHK